MVVTSSGMIVSESYVLYTFCDFAAVGCHSLQNLPKFCRWKGLAALLQAPYDLFVVFSIKAIGLGPSGTIWDDGELWNWQAAEIMAYYGFSYIYVCDAHLTLTFFDLEVTQSHNCVIESKLAKRKKSVKGSGRVVLPPMILMAQFLMA